MKLIPVSESLSFPSTICLLLFRCFCCTVSGNMVEICPN